MTDVKHNDTSAKTLPGSIVAELTHVDVHYGTWHALRDVSFTVSEGEVVGLLGHNGAGKTTTIRLLNGLLRPTGGAVRVLGVDPLAGGAAFRMQTSVVTDALGLHERETARQAMAFHGELWNMNRDDVAERGHQLLVRFGLGSAVDIPVKNYSRGMRQRLALARSILHRPKMLLLDEPTLGMDPVGRQEFRTILRTLTDDGTAVLMSTHDLGEVERACDNIVILHKGEVVLKGSAAHTLDEFARNIEVTVDLLGSPNVDGLQALSSIHAVVVSGNSISFVAEDRRAIADVVRALNAAGADVVGVKANEPTLEDVYLSMHTEDRR